jgi:archaellum component FlaG (FlaF/FlaG flagellin family)
VQTLSGVTVTDDLGGYPFGGGTVYPLTYEVGSATLFIDGVLQPAPVVVAGPPLVISVITLPGGSDAVIVYQARANEYSNPVSGGTITNTATVTGGGIAAPLTDTATVPVTEEPDLSIAKAICPPVVTDNGQLTYTFIIQNTGNTAILATDNLIVSDNFNPILSNIAVTLNGATLVEGTGYTYDDTTGAFATLPGIVTVDAATYTQDPTSGLITVNPGVSVITITGTV